MASMDDLEWREEGGDAQSMLLRTDAVSCRMWSKVAGMSQRGPR